MRKVHTVYRVRVNMNRGKMVIGNKEKEDIGYGAGNRKSGPDIRHEVQ